MKKTKPIVGVVIPAYKVKRHITKVVKDLSPNISHICVVDDACPEGSGRVIQEDIRDERVKVIFHSQNQGVGGSMKTGFKYLLQKEVDVIVKLDGDGQMNSQYIENLVKPILSGDADYTKGNRFYSFQSINKMPRMRLFGNILLSLMSKASSGYWNVFDPNNGFIAISGPVLREIDLEKISQRYFFESDMLFRLNLMKAKVVDVPMQAFYGDEKSSLSLWKAAIEFPYKHIRNLVKRLLLTYYMRDFSFPGVQLFFGMLLTMTGSVIGIYNFFRSQALEISTPPGTLVLFLVLILTGVQLLLSFVSHDLNNVPNRSITEELKMVKNHPTSKDNKG